MTTKLTLTLDDAVIRKAKLYAEDQKTSLSRIVEGYFQRITGPEEKSLSAAELPPITRKLLGIASVSESETGKTDKELLLEALEEKFL